MRIPRHLQLRTFRSSGRSGVITLSFFWTKFPGWSTVCVHFAKAWAGVGYKKPVLYPILCHSLQRSRTHILPFQPLAHSSFKTARCTFTPSVSNEGPLLHPQVLVYPECSLEGPRATAPFCYNKPLRGR